MIPRTDQINVAEEALSSLALVALVGGNRPPLTPAMVREQLQSFYLIDANVFTVSRQAPEDFLVRFYSRDDLEAVVDAPVPVGTPFYLLWRRWRCQSVGSPGQLKYKVVVGLKGMPAHIWGIDAAERILGSSCAKLTCRAGNHR